MRSVDSRGMLMTALAVIIAERVLFSPENRDDTLKCNQSGLEPLSQFEHLEYAASSENDV